MSESPFLPRVEPVGESASAGESPSAALSRASAGVSPSAVVLVLHGGRSHSRESGERKRLTYRRMLPFARALAKHGSLAVFVLRYRYRGWNAPAKDAQRDAEWALEELARRYPDVPVVLLGHSMGGRAALGAAGGRNVTAVCALAPWLDSSDPVTQLAGRTVLIAHGDRERWTSPEESYEYAVRAKPVAARIARFDVRGAGHFMLSRAADWQSLVVRFVLGVTGIEPEDPDIANAFTQPTPSGLRVELAAH